MRVLIVDDEAPARQRLRSLLEELDGPWEVAGEAAGGEQAVSLCREGRMDLVLLDIRMPGMDGMQAARLLAQLPNPPVVVFTTAYEEHALDAFEARAMDYLLKPIRKQRLQQALERVTELRPGAAAPEDEPTQYLTASYRGGLQRVPLDEVVYLRADNKYVVARHLHGELLLEESLKQLETRLGNRFLRIHRNALVAVAYLAGLRRGPEGQPEVFLRELEECLEVSRRHLPLVRQHLQESGSL